MLVSKITKSNQAAIVKQAVRVLQQGGAVVYPTETSYGLGADFLNPRAVKKVYQIKGRSFKKRLTVLISSLAMAKKLVKFDNTSQRLAKKYWPGPLTLVIASRAKLGEAISSKKIAASRLAMRGAPRHDHTLALRISSNRLATSIVRKLNRPLTATSANLSGYGESYLAQDVIRQFKGGTHQPDLIIDAGRLPKVKVSTIAKVSQGKIKILRQGDIKL